MSEILLFIIGYAALISLIKIGFMIEQYITFRRISRWAQAQVDEWNRRHNL